MFRVCVCRYQRLLWNLNKPINPCRSRRLYFLLRCPERPCPHIYCFFYYEHQRFLSNKERAYVAAWGRQGKSASPSVFYQSAPLFFKKPLVATVHVLDRRDSSHKWKWSFFRKVHFAGADWLDTECGCRWVTCIHRRRVASMLLAVSPLLPWWHVNQMSIRCQSKPNVQLSPEQHHQRLSACKKLTIPTVFWSIIPNNRCILWYIFFWENGNHQSCNNKYFYRWLFSRSSVKIATKPKTKAPSVSSSPANSPKKTQKSLFTS